MEIRYFLANTKRYSGGVFFPVLARMIASRKIESAISEQYPDAYRYAPGCFVLDRDLLLVWWSEGATSEIFGVSPEIGSYIDFLDFGTALDETDLRREFAYFSSRINEGAEISKRGRPVAAGQPIPIKWGKIEVTCIVAIQPLILDDLYLLILLKKLSLLSGAGIAAKALTDPVSPFKISETTPMPVQIAALVSAEWRTNRGLVLYGSATAILLLSLWHLPSIEKMIKNGAPPSAKSPVDIDVNKVYEKKTDGVTPISVEAGK